MAAAAGRLAEVAGAIQAKDSRFLVDLPEIGKRTAEQIVAELHGKVEAFLGAAPHPMAELSGAGEEAVSVLVQLGERRADAVALVDRVETGADGCTFLLCEAVATTTLAQLLASGPLPLPAALDATRSLARFLEHLHARQLLARD